MGNLKMPKVEMSVYVNICYLFLKDPIAGTFTGNVTGS